MRSVFINILYAVFYILIVAVVVNLIVIKLKTHVVQQVVDSYERSIDNIPLSLKDFLVRTDTCRIPDVWPFPPEIAKIYKPIDPIKCTANVELVSKKFNFRLKRFRLHINWQYKFKYMNKTDRLNCCYKKIMMTKDKHYKLTNCIPFFQNHLIPSHIKNGIIVECLRNGKKLIYRDAFYFLHVPFKNETEDFQKFPNDNEFGIQLIGVDSLSQLNFRRTMPYTFAYLLQSGWFQLMGYNKIGASSYSNIVALLTGSNETRLKECFIAVNSHARSCLKLLLTLQKYGYLIAYCEEAPKLGALHFLATNLQNSTLNYNMRTFFIAIDNELPFKYFPNTTTKFCIGRRSSPDFIFDAFNDFTMYTVANGDRLFGMYWLHTYSHDRFEGASSMDQAMLTNLVKWQESGVFERNVILFFGDNGMRFGPLRKETKTGFLEERLPMMFIWLPARLRYKHPEFVYALDVNKHRLASPYDIYMTLKDLLATFSNKTEDKIYESTQTTSCTNCQSVLKPIPANRTCKDAGIPLNWCTCLPYLPVKTTSKTIFEIGEMIVAKINSYLESKNLLGLCRKLRLHRINEVKMRWDNFTIDEYTIQDIDDLDYNDNGILLQIRFNVVANILLEYEASIIYFKHTHKIDFDMEHLSALDSYEQYAECVKDESVKQFCLCA